MPFDGKNPHSIVIMDNASIHHVDGIMELITGVGALLIFLPPYSPDYNPIEEAFSKVKTLIKAYEEEIESNHMDMLDIVQHFHTSQKRTAMDGLIIVEFIMLLNHCN